MSNNVIAVVNGKEITEEQFQAFVNNMPAEQKAYLQNPQAVDYFKDQFVSMYLFAELGYEEKIDETDEFKSMMDDAKRSIIGQIAMNKVFEKLTVSDEEALNFYNENKDKYQSPVQAHAKHILMDSEDDLKAVQADIESGKVTFEDAAMAHSTCPSGQKGGDLGTFGPGQMVKEFDEVSFSAEIGKIVGPIKTQFGYHLVKVEDRTEAGTTPFEEVKDQVKSQLLSKKQQEVYSKTIDELKAKYCK